MAYKLPRKHSNLVLLCILRFSVRRFPCTHAKTAVFRGALQVASLIVGIIAFVSGKSYVGDVNSGDMENVFVFIFSVIWAVIKLAITYFILVISLALTIPALIISIAANNSALATMWSWSWGEVAVGWFSNGTEGITLFFAFLMSTAVGLLFDESFK